MLFHLYDLITDIKLGQKGDENYCILLFHQWEFKWSFFSFYCRMDPGVCNQVVPHQTVPKTANCLQTSSQNQNHQKKGGVYTTASFFCWKWHSINSKTIQGLSCSVLLKWILAKEYNWLHLTSKSTSTKHYVCQMFLYSFVRDSTFIFFLCCTSLQSESQSWY